MKSPTEKLLEKAILETSREIAKCSTDIMLRSTPNMPKYIEKLNNDLMDYEEKLNLIR